VKFFLVRNIPDDLWVKVKRRAAKEGRSLRWVIIRLLERYSKAGIDDEPK
jgi:hypothetical protein